MCLFSFDKVSFCPSVGVTDGLHWLAVSQNTLFLDDAEEVRWVRDGYGLKCFAFKSLSSFLIPELWPVQLPPPHSLRERAPRCLYQWFSFLWATGKRHLWISSMQHLLRVKLSRRVQSEGRPRFREEQKNHTHPFIGRFRWAELRRLKREKKVIPSLCVFTLRRELVVRYDVDIINDHCSYQH